MIGESFVVLILGGVIGFVVGWFSAGALQIWKDTRKSEAGK
jgi:ABC-type antimicrobial peptide transport system permease subunit